MQTGLQQRISTRLAFLAAGMAMSGWAPLVPYAQARTGVAAGQLGLLLLCLGIGSLMAMPVTGMLAARFGFRPVIMFAGLGCCAVFLTGENGFTEAQGGLGYAAFAVAMTIGRLNGDRIVERWGGARVLMVGGCGAALGFFATLLAPSPWLALLGFALVGLGAANVVPVLFSAAGRQRDMPASAAVSAITTIGYGGILAGPALIGFAAQVASLQLAFFALACGMLVVALNARIGA